MSSDSVIAISAGVIALASLFVSVWSAGLTRRHNRLSVMPHLRVDHIRRQSETIEVLLMNNGLGAAVITGFIVLLDGVALPTLGEALVKTGLVDEAYTYTLTVADALSAGEQVLLLSLPLLEQTNTGFAKIQTYLTRITYKINYESMYGDKLVLNRNAIGGAAD